jgi:hypothetical protein
MPFSEFEKTRILKQRLMSNGGKHKKSGLLSPITAQRNGHNISALISRDVHSPNNMQVASSIPTMMASDSNIELAQ